LIRKKKYSGVGKSFVVLSIIVSRRHRVVQKKSFRFSEQVHMFVRDQKRKSVAADIVQ